MQRLLESITIALQAIWANKLRSLMTVCGNIVSVGSIVTVVSLIQGMNALVSDAIVNQVGADSFTIQRRPPIRTDRDDERARNNPPITLQEAEAIRRHSTSIRAIVAVAQRSTTASRGSQELENVQVQGLTSEYIQFPTFGAERGRMMSGVEVDRGRFVALLGWDVADKLFGPTDPIDKTISIAGVPFHVVGVSKRKGTIIGNSQDNFAIVPLGAYRKLFGARQSLSLMIRPTSPALINTAMDDATVALRVSRRLKAAAPDNFGLFSSDSLMALYKQATNGIFAVLVGIVSLSLVVGGIVIMNIMLMVVSERTREIGLRKALGARRQDIMSQILTESVTLSTIGGIIGIALGFGLSLIIAAVSPLSARLEPWSVALSIGVTAAVGLFFGAYPAAQASRLDPIEALRRE